MLYVHKIVTMQTGDTESLTDDIFFSGCKLHCPTCFNKETWNRKDSLKMNPRDVIKNLSDTKLVAFLGGEPTEQNHFDLATLTFLLHKQGKKVIVFTNSEYPSIINVDYWHIDIKPSTNKSYHVLNSNITYGIIATKDLGSLQKQLQFLDRKAEIYVKKNIFDSDTCNIDKTVAKLKELGFNNIYIQKKIRVM